MVIVKFRVREVEVEEEVHPTQMVQKVVMVVRVVVREVAVDQHRGQRA
jgi:hypothetical protein